MTLPHLLSSVGIVWFSTEYMPCICEIWGSKPVKCKPGIYPAIGCYVSIKIWDSSYSRSKTRKRIHEIGFYRDNEGEQDQYEHGKCGTEFVRHILEYFSRSDHGILVYGHEKVFKQHDQLDYKVISILILIKCLIYESIIKFNFQKFEGLLNKKGWFNYRFYFCMILQAIGMTFILEALNLKKNEIPFKFYLTKNKLVIS